MLYVRVKVDLEAFAVVTVLDLTAYRPLADRADPRYDAVTRQLGGVNLRGLLHRRSLRVVSCEGAQF